MGFPLSSSVKAEGVTHQEGGVSHRWKIPETHRKLKFDKNALNAALFSLMKQEDRRIYLSPATLIVVPLPLIEQWKHEITKHFKDNHIRVCAVTRKGHYPDRLWQLAWNYDVVLTSFTYLSSSTSASLQQIHWLRIVLDEGHLIGTTLSYTTRKARISALESERRWIITGTPAPDLAHQSTVSHLYPLIQFLKISPFCRFKSVWDSAIQRPFEAGLPEGSSC